MRNNIYYMRYLKTFESHSTKDILIIVDVQKSFSKFFTNKYVEELKKYCNKFNKVYQIWDNHVDGKNVDKDYLYDENPDEMINHEDLYEFPNQVDLIEKRYNYDVTVDFYKPVSVTIVGGADSECLEDIEVAAKALGVNFKNNDRYIYSATNCPIK